jgi:hypothetical protein
LYIFGTLLCCRIPSNTSWRVKSTRAILWSSYGRIWFTGPDNQEILILWVFYRDGQQ